MSITVGLDFGTHQTKICIEDGSNPVLKTYEFFEFTDLDGGKTLLFPSVVQINNDNTVSYGFVDRKRAKLNEQTASNSNPALKKPTLILPDKPLLREIPAKPKQPLLKGASLKDLFKAQKKYESDMIYWKIECARIDEENKASLEEWELECIGIENDYKYDVEEYNKEVEKHRNNFRHKNTNKRMTFYYFKMASFYNQSWHYPIESEIISTWYLAYILLLLQEKYGDMFYTQMGVPFTIQGQYSSRQENKAYQILIAAYKLTEFYGDLNSFLNENYISLINNTHLTDFTNDDINYYGLNILPEAYAGLISVTKNKSLDRGMHLLVDIGGGTTDIAFFTITKNSTPDIHRVLSIPKGLNFIFEKHLKTNRGYEVYELQNQFRQGSKKFKSAVKIFTTDLKKTITKLIDEIEKGFSLRKSIHKIDKRRLYESMEYQPTVYCGGGSIYSSLRVVFSYFKDILLINRKTINIPYIENNNIDEKLFPILATSYGLSIQSESEITMSNIEEVFAKLPPNESNSDHDKYDHHLSDWS